MSKPFYRSKKLWSTILTAAAVMLADYLGKPELGAPLAALGLALVVSIGLADFGKESTAAEIQADKDAE
jgi:hypothetical protein